MRSHDEIRSLLGVYALDAIDDPDELSAVEAHLARCAECRAEVDEHRSVTTAMAEADLRAPSGLWDRIASGLDQEPAGPVRGSWWPIQGLTSVAAAIAVVTAIGMTALWADANAEVDDLQQRVDELEAGITEAQLTLGRDPMELAVERARTRSGAVEVTVGGDIGSSQAVVLPDGSGWLTEVEFAPLDPGSTYQLWAIQDGTVISAGILGADPGTVAFHIDAERLNGLVVTIESAGGVVSSSNEAAAAWLPSGA